MGGGARLVGERARARRPLWARTSVSRRRGDVVGVLRIDLVVAVREEGVAVPVADRLGVLATEVRDLADVGRPGPVLGRRTDIDMEQR